MKLRIWIFVVLAIFCLAEAVEAVGIKVVNNAEIVLGDRSDDKIKIIDDRNLRDGLNYNDLEIVAELRRGYEDHDAIAICDVNGDGLGEIVFGDASDDRVHVYDRNLVEKTSINVGFESEDDLACGDVDRDGKDEIVVGDSSGNRIIIIQVGAQQNEWSPWTAYISIPHGFWGGDRIAVCDVLDSNRAVGSDGRAEIIVADTDDNKIHIYEYIGGGGSDRGSEIKNFDVKFKLGDGRNTIQYDVEDEIACGDVDGDGVDEIVYGNGADTHKIYVYNANGSIKFEFDAYFDNSDELAVGDVNMDGKDEIIKGDASDDKIHVYSYNGGELAVINVGYEIADGVAVGDVDGDSLMVEEVGCKNVLVPNKVIAVINAPPKHIGVNYRAANPRDPYYADFYVEYVNTQNRKTSFTAASVQSVQVSAGIATAFSSLLVSETLKIGVMQSWTSWHEKVETQEIEIAEGLKTWSKDVAILLTTNLELCEFRIIKPQEMAIINGEQQYLLVSIPHNMVVTTVELDNPNDYTQFRIPQIHTVGNILTYPNAKNRLVNYQSQNEILSRGLEVGNSQVSFYYSQEMGQSEKRTFKTDFAVSVSYLLECSFGMGAAAVQLSGYYGASSISIAELRFTEDTDFRVYYAGNPSIGADDKYTVAFALYTDSSDGHLVLDWIVTETGRNYTSQRVGGTMGASLGAGTGSARLGRTIWGDIGAMAITENPLLYIENAQMPNGSTVVIPINIRNANNVRNMDIEVRYPNNILRPIDAMQGSLTQDSLFESNIIEERIRLAFVDSDGFSGNGTVAAIRFQVIGNPGDEGSLLLSASGNKVNDVEIRFEIANGIFRVQSAERMTRGDCNGDGIISSADALIALQMSVGKIEPREVADFNQDGKVTSQDAALILENAAQTSALRSADALRGYHPGIKGGHEVLGQITPRR